MLRERRLHTARAAARLRAMEAYDVNYHLAPGPAGEENPRRQDNWHLDTVRCPLPSENPGSPDLGGAWEIACRLVHDYQFADPRILRALYAREGRLLGRNMLLEGRFCGLRFDMPVRVTSVVDETRGTGQEAQRVWGWGYQTLQGHLEEGALVYEVIKHLHTGDVEFVIAGHSRRARIGNPVVALGFILFGRMTQQRFYRKSAHRLRHLVQAELAGAAPLRVETLPGDTALALAPSRARDLVPRRPGAGGG
ncbi:DUF1990 family protein [Streptomyces sp. NPDC059262]|uniref:DUF1990 family protein n=1 Tax=Streptomyces sp. NPDC059262 TaxID=3346797 RepID=UPI003678D820